VLAIYKTTQQGLERIEHPKNGCWINVIDPSHQEINDLKEWGIETDLINYSLDLDEMSHMERDEEYIFILLRIPYFQGPGTDIPHITVPLGIILTDRYVITICRYENDITRVLVNDKYQGMKTAKRFRFALYIFLEAATHYLGHLRDINKETEVLEDQLQKSTRNREVLELLKMQKSLVYFTTGLHSNQVVMERLQRTQMFKQYEEDQELLEDVITENQQAIEMTGIQTNILNGLMDAFASIISNNLNAVMKALAALTIIINIPTIVASFYGMNVRLPGGEHPLAFLMVLGIASGLILFAVLVFFKRDWF